MHVHSVASSQVIHRGSLRIAAHRCASLRIAAHRCGPRSVPRQQRCSERFGVPKWRQRGSAGSAVRLLSNHCQTVVHRLLRTVRPFWCCTCTVAACGGIAMRIAMVFVCFKKTGFESLILLTVTCAVVDCRQDR